MIDKELEQTGEDQTSDIERLRNLLMQAQQDSFTPARECLAALFDRCFAAIRAQKPLYLLKKIWRQLSSLRQSLYTM